MNNLLKTLNQLKTGELDNQVKIEKIVVGNEIAIIGIAFKLPYAQNMDEFYEVLKNKKDCVTYPQKERLNDIVSYLDYRGVEPSSYQIIEAAFLPEIDKFDCTFFKTSLIEAGLMDPCQRLFLEIAWHAFEDAGYSREKLKGSRTGVFLGRPHSTEYYKRVKEFEPQMAIVAGPGNIDPIIASRISYMFDLSGPSFLVDSACSSSLVATHLACQSIRNNECDMALVGGVNLIMEPIRYHNEEIPDIVSSTGRTRTFSNDSDGTGRGEGCIAIFLKPLEKAVRDSDNIHAIIKSSACNNDGSSIGITAPSMKAQEDVIMKAWELGNIDPETIGYVEAHGTGTKLGDPIEIEALTNAFQRYTQRRQFCGVGAAKTNYGHMDSAAGLLGLLKGVVSLKSRELLPNIHFKLANKKIDFVSSPLFVVDRAMEWHTDNKSPARCGVSAFGLSGTNCHIILEEFTGSKDGKQDGRDGEGPAILPISAKTEAALKAQIQNYIKFLHVEENISVHDLCYTARTGREHFNYRIAIIGESVRDLESKLVYIKENGLVTKPEQGIYYGYHKIANQVKSSSESVSDSNGIASISELHKYAKDYVEGCNVDWKGLNGNQARNIVSVPLYPFEKKRCWIEISGVKIKKAGSEISPNYISDVRNENMEQENLVEKNNEILEQLQRFVANLFGVEPEDVDTGTSYFDIGIDSISVIQLKQEVKNSYNIDISAEQLFGEVNTLKSLAKFIQQKLPPAPKNLQVQVNGANEPRQELAAAGIYNKEPYTTTQNFNLSDSTIASSKVESCAEDAEIKRIINTQLDIMSQQLQLLRHMGAGPNVQDTPVVAAKKEFEGGFRPKAVEHKYQKKDPLNEPDRLLQKFIIKTNSALTEKQKLYLQSLVESFEKKTATSKKLTQEYRSVWANGRAIQGFSKAWKEMIYPIIASKAKGSKMWDIDGNEYVDFAMGFGVNLFGYNDPYIKQAIEDYLEDGVILGALTQTPGEVAELISEITGVERVAFCNSGTEAVMNLVRIARTTTAKDMIALFSGAFHGTFDGVYVLKDASSSTEYAIPLSLGTPINMAKDIIILEYGEDNSLEIIKEHAGELAAVLVEPVQSRNPDLQPGEFLHALRKITSDMGIALIFDEIITGFRVHAGGAQAHFGVQADLVSYGKVIGGGLPLGIFAGKAKFMDKVDGGPWNFGDDSSPSGFLAQTGGTFCHHPLAMASAKAVLNRIKSNGNSIQENLNKKTQQMAKYLNDFFDNCRIPFKIAYFGSQFIFKTKESTLLRFLYYKLIEKGFYLWEGATCFISTAHSDDDIAAFAKAVKDCCLELHLNGCFDFDMPLNITDIEYVKAEMFDDCKQKRYIEASCSLITHDKGKARAKELFDEDPNIEAIYPLSAMQEMILAQNINYNNSGYDISILQYMIDGGIDLPNFKKAWQLVIDRHSILRTAFLWRRLKEPLQVVYSSRELPFIEIDLSDKALDEQSQVCEEYILSETTSGFDISQPPLMKLILIKLGPQQRRLVVKYQNSLFDGWSSSLIFHELLKIYEFLIAGKNIELEQTRPYMNYISWLKAQNSEEIKDFWINELKGFAAGVQGQVQSCQTRRSFDEGKSIIEIDEEKVAQIKQYAKENQLTLYTIFQGAWGILQSQIQNKDDVLIATVCSGRPENLHGVGKMVGLFSNVLPMRIKYERGRPISAWLKELQDKNLKLKNYEHTTIQQIAQWSEIPLEVIQDALYIRTLVYLNYPQGTTKGESGISIRLEDEQSYVNSPLRVYIELFDGLKIIFRYDRHYFDENYILKLSNDFKDIIMNIKNYGL